MIPTPTPTPTATSTRTPTSTPTRTSTVTPTTTQTSTGTITPTFTPTATSTHTRTETPTVIFTPSPSSSPTGTPTVTLSADITADDAAIPVSDITQFLDSGTIQIDQELMNYDGKQPATAASGLGATGSGQPGFLLNVQRGVNDTAPAPHQSGAMVIVVTLPPCGGDCNGDGEVTVNEIITMVNIAIGSVAVDVCTTGDPNGDAEITINEIISAVNNALNGCPVASAMAAGSDR